MMAEEIFDKLQPTLRREGIEVDFLGTEGAVVNIRARRVGAGVPVAFVVKALAGTCRRYLSGIEDVCLAEYDPGQGIPVAASQTFEPVFQHSAAVHALLLGGVPVVDLTGLGRRDAIRAIEGCVLVWGERSPMIAIQGLTADAPLRAARKWAAVYRARYREIREVTPDRWEVHFSDHDGPATAELRSKGDEVMPGRIFLTSSF